MVFCVLVNLNSLVLGSCLICSISVSLVIISLSSQCSEKNMLLLGVYLGVYFDLLNLNENLTDFLVFGCRENADGLVCVVVGTEEFYGFLLNAEKNFFNQFGRFVFLAPLGATGVDLALALVLVSVGFSTLSNGCTGCVVCCETYVRYT